MKLVVELGELTPRWLVGRTVTQRTIELSDLTAAEVEP
jgi:hypothetical protein